MPQFVIEREIPGLSKLSDSEFRALSQKSVAVLRGMGPEIQWLHSYVTGDKLYCVYIAPDEKTIQEHANAGIPGASNLRRAASYRSHHRRIVPDNHVGTAAPGCPAERSSAGSFAWLYGLRVLVFLSL